MNVCGRDIVGVVRSYQQPITISATTDCGASGLVRNELRGARQLQMCRPLADPAVTASLEAALWTPREGADGSAGR